MTAKPEPEEQSTTDDDGESAFWDRFDQGLEKHLGEDKFDAALDRWLAKADLELEQQEKAGPAGTKETKSGATQDAQAGAGRDDANAERGGPDDDGRSDAERKRDAGRVGRRAPSPYWERVQKLLFG